MKYINMKPRAIPGIEVKGGAAYCELAGEAFPITSFLAHETLGLIPVLDIPQMSDERWQELARGESPAFPGVVHHCAVADDCHSPKSVLAARTASIV